MASSPAALERDQGDVWDSGKVDSDETAQIAYAGKPLASRQVCHWKVRAWDRDGQPSGWSKPARWEMGLLKPADWSAQWIEAELGGRRRRGRLALRREVDLVPGAGRRSHQGGAGRRPLLPLPRDRACRREAQARPADPHRGRSIHSVCQWQASRSVRRKRRLEAAAALRSFAALAGRRKRRRRDRQEHRIAGRRLCKDRDPVPGQAAASDRQRSALEDSNKAADGWNTASFDDSGWQDSFEIADFGQGVWQQAGSGRRPGRFPSSASRSRWAASRLLRPASTPRRWGSTRSHQRPARGRPRARPDWTDYRKRVRYQVYDVASLLKQGDNALAALLGDGWYSGHIGNGGFQFFGKARPC